MTEHDEWLEAEKEMHALADKEYPGIPCDNFSCIDIILVQVYNKLGQEENEILKERVKEYCESIPGYFRLHKDYPLEREHYERRVKLHVEQLINYLEGRRVKSRVRN